MEPLKVTSHFDITLYSINLRLNKINFLLDSFRNLPVLRDCKANKVFGTVFVNFRKPTPAPDASVMRSCNYFCNGG